MTSRGRNNDWEEDYNNPYDNQYQEDDLREQFDYCRLYIVNIPKGLSEEGLRTAFAKYGTLTEVFVSKNPAKKFALVKYETPGEAKLAMTKLNNTDPMKLNISIARKPKPKNNNNNNNQSRDSMDRSYTNAPNRNILGDGGSVSSRKSSRLHEDTNGDDIMDDSLPALDDDDQDVQIKSLQLELQRLQVQEQKVLLKQQLVQLEAAKKKNANLTQSTTSNRCILPDGRIVVRNVNERNLEPRDVEGSFAAGAGDSLTIPALQRGCLCVVCGARADSCCARCGLTPYCSVGCQRRDWPDRHRAVCHNLARLAGKTDVPGAVKAGVSIPAKSEPEPYAVEKEIVPPPAPLRRPHSPAKTTPRRDDDLPDLTSPKKTTPTQNNKQQTRSFNHGPRNFNNNNQANNRQNRSGDRKPMRQENGEEQEDRRANAKTQSPAHSAPQPKPAEPTPARPQPPSEPRPGPSQHRPQTGPSQPEAKLAPAVAPMSVANVTPSKNVKKLVPKNYLIELLSIDDVALLSVEATGEACKSEKPGLVCLSMHERFEAQYQDLCEVFTVDCDAEKKTVTPSPGESFSYLNASDGGWYRARCLNPTSAALVDSSKVVALTPEDKLKPLSDKYNAAPEFCCLLNAERVKIGDNLRCKLISKTADGFKVSLEDVESGKSMGEGEVCRWLPTVEYPRPPPPEPAAEGIKPAPPPVAVQPAIPEVPRPDVVNNSKVLLVDATTIDQAFVRPSDPASQRRFDQILEDVVLFGRDATPLKEPPTKGQVVIGKFTDGLFYRALCKRTNVKQNKYLLEYIEFGNIEITALENIYPCPPSLDLASKPTEASLVTLQCNCGNAFTPPAAAYLETLKDEMVELTLTLPSGAQTAASGSAVCLTEVAKNESVNKKVEQMCTPEWKKMEERGVDVVETKPLMYSDLECLELPANGCELDILDISALEAGSVCGCQRGLPHQKHVRERLTQQMEEYCNSELGKEPYLPKFEELCIARCPPYPQWFRAVLLEQSPGSPGARVCYVDYGNVEEVPVSLLRKMLPEFVRGQPALASHLEIKDFPEKVTQEMLVRAVEYMKIDDEGRGTLTVTRCEKQDSGLYLVHAPELIKAMLGQ